MQQAEPETPDADQAGEHRPTAPARFSRRVLLRAASGGAGLVLFGCRAPDPGPSAVGGDFGIYLEIAPSGETFITTPNAEMGQGTYDALAKIVAEELDADWQRVSIRLSGADPRMVNPKVFGQLTGNSEAVRGYWSILRRAGAAARQMLREAAAERAGVPVATTRTEAGYVLAGGERFGYGELAAAAAARPVPAEPELKQPEAFRLLGRDWPRKETPPKVDGSAVFGIDVRLPGMLSAALAMPRGVAGELLPVDDAPARAVEGVIDVVQVHGGVAVIADDFWTAKTAAERLDVRTAGGPGPSTDEVYAALARALDDDSAVAAPYENAPGANLESSRAAVRAALDGAATRLSLVHRVPMLAHGALEPPACTALFGGDRLVLWAPHQNPKSVTELATRLTGLDAAAVTVHRTFLGGGFGRKWHTDFVQQAIEAAMAVPGRPVKLTWTREQDTQHDFYRPASASRIDVGLDATGRIVAWSGIIAGQSLGAATRRRYDPTAPDQSLQKAPIYRLGTRHLESRAVTLPIPIGWWRSVAHAPTLFFIESAVDEIAARLGADPFDYRLAMLDDARARRVLEELRTVSGWARDPGPRAGRGHGIALSPGYDCQCAVMAEVALEADTVRVTRVVAVLDCGFALEPENVRRQLAGGLLFGLGPALAGEIRLEAGEVQASNLGDIGAASPFDVPELEVHLLPGNGPPGGIGEVGTPPIAPAVCNAIAAAGGPRIRELPIARAGLQVKL